MEQGGKERLMRRMRAGIVLCLMFLLVPVYLWKVAGWWQPTPPPPVIYDPVKDRPEFPELSGEESIELLARNDPVELLRQCLLKYRPVKAYTCTLCKHERLQGKLNPPEIIEAWYKEEPYSVMMHWKQGAGMVCASLYVAGENDNKMCVRLTNPAGKLLGVPKSSPDSAEAKANTRYLITEFGLRAGTERTYKAWKALRDQGVSLKTEYLGLHKNVPEAGNRDCHVVRRLCNPPEEEGLTEVTVYIDAETWFQVGSVLKAGDDLIGSYWFKDINLNPNFEANRFKPETLKQY